MFAAKQDDDTKEDTAAQLGTEIRRSMARIAGARSSQEDAVRIGRLIDQRIEQSYRRGLRAALAGKPHRPASSDH